MGFRNGGTMPQHSAKSFICVDSDFMLYTKNERNEKVFFFYICSTSKFKIEKRHMVLRGQTNSLDNVCTSFFFVLFFFNLHLKLETKLETIEGTTTKMKNKQTLFAI